MYSNFMFIDVKLNFLMYSGRCESAEPFFLISIPDEDSPHSIEMLSALSYIFISMIRAAFCAHYFEVLFYCCWARQSDKTFFDTLYGTKYHRAICAKLSPTAIRVLASKWGNVSSKINLATAYTSGKTCMKS